MNVASKKERHASRQLVLKIMIGVMGVFLVTSHLYAVGGSQLAEEEHESSFQAPLRGRQLSSDQKAEMEQLKATVLQLEKSLQEQRHVAKKKDTSERDQLQVRVHELENNLKMSHSSKDGEIKDLKAEISKLQSEKEQLATKAGEAEAAAAAKEQPLPQQQQQTSSAITHASWDEIDFAVKSPDTVIRGEDVRSTLVPLPRNLRLAYIGDSLTRYQYLSLAHFLRYGHFPDPLAQPNFVLEKTHENWMDFYNNTNHGLLPFEKCDCFRPETRDIRRLVTEVRENRFYYDQISGNSVTYLMKWGWHKMTMTWNSSSIHKSPPRYTAEIPRQLPPALDLEGDWLTTINYLAELEPKPNVVVMNSGLWKPKHLKQPAIQDAIVEALKKHNMIGIYKTTTKRLEDKHPTKNEPYEEQLCQKLICLDTSWTDYLAKDMYWDNLHFIEPIYKRLNIQLLQKLQEHNLIEFADSNQANTTRLTNSRGVSLILPEVKPLYGAADDKADNDALPHPHAGARTEDGTLGLVVNPDPARLMAQNSLRPLDCPKGPFPGVEEAGGYEALQKIRKELKQSKNSILRAKKVPRILCMVYTQESAHDRLRAIASTWGKECDGFFAASTKTDHSLGAINLLHKGEEAYDNMWQKIRSMWAYAFDYYKDDYDYFHICGDDTFLVPDNFRAYLMSEEVERLQNGYMDTFSQNNPKSQKWAKVNPRPLLLGAPHFRGRGMLFPDGGPGYTFNRAALEFFGKEGLLVYLADNRDPREDVFIGGFFEEQGMRVSDTRDAAGGLRYIDTDLQHASQVTHTGMSRLQPAKLEGAFPNFKWTYGMDGISSQVVALHLKWSEATTMDDLIYRYYEMLNYDESHCNVAVVEQKRQ